MDKTLRILGMTAIAIGMQLLLPLVASAASTCPSSNSSCNFGASPLSAQASEVSEIDLVIAQAPPFSGDTVSGGPPNTQGSGTR